MELNRGTQIILGLGLSISVWIYFLLFGPHLLLMIMDSEVDSVVYHSEATFQMAALVSPSFGECWCWRLKADCLSPGIALAQGGTSLRARAMLPPWEWLASKNWPMRNTKAWPLSFTDDISEGPLKLQNYPCGRLRSLRNLRSDFWQICSIKKRYWIYFVKFWIIG